MRIKTVSIGSLLLCACAGTPRGPTDSAWAEFVRSELLEVRVERRLYQQSGNPHFLIRVRLTNRTDSALGVDLRDGSRVFHPNQWGGLDEPFRGIIDESYAEPQALTPELSARLIAEHQAKALVSIPAGESIEYFREFNASGRADVDAVDTPYLFVSIMGQLFVTDGVRVENLLPMEAHAVYLRTPVAWSQVPDSARVIPE